ncbi:DsbA family oxidoreductase [Agrobacterium rosae]|uniref:DsbA family oxidoreductase n=1 Tax=Agrobacterium rosae TaxID=1972867 RepID=UPI00203466DE|nr:DsbA family protein [Agrobacterium rosae]MCM2435420.1 DsbA family protein [Agrobacterium rosae]MDX8315928.1 DsbA family protein [Agrobacterium rosae]
MTTLRIDLFTEISCPWCIIGLHRLDKVLAERFPQIDADIRHHPVILLDCPPEGFKIVDLMRSRYGITDPAKAWARPHAEARASGLDLDLGRQPFAYPTVGAHTLIRLAGPRGTQHSLVAAITWAYFQDAANIGDADVLADIASKHGFEREEAYQLVSDPVQLERTRGDVANAAAHGVTSVPHFVFGGEFVLNGGRSEDEIAAAIERASAPVSEISHVG